MPKEYSSLQEIVDQLASCGYETSDQYHDLENNTALIALKKRAAAEQGECAKLQSGEAPVQQLQAKIAALANDIELRSGDPISSMTPEYVVGKLRQLSAVQ
jgi:hypothetical protein